MPAAASGAISSAGSSKSSTFSENRFASCPPNEAVLEQAVAVARGSRSEDDVGRSLEHVRVAPAASRRTDHLDGEQGSAAPAGDRGREPFTLPRGWNALPLVRRGCRERLPQDVDGRLWWNPLLKGGAHGPLAGPAVERFDMQALEPRPRTLARIEPGDRIGERAGGRGILRHLTDHQVDGGRVAGEPRHHFAPVEGIQA